MYQKVDIDAPAASRYRILWELRAVLTEAMALAGADGVRVGDLAFRRRPRSRPDASGRPSPQGHCAAPLRRYERDALAMASARGEVRRRDVVARCMISRDSARRVLVGLVGLGLLDRVGRGRATGYVPREAGPTAGSAGGNAVPCSRDGLPPSAIRVARAPGPPSTSRLVPVTSSARAEP